MFILGIDPGIERCGWGVLSETKSVVTPVDYGCIFTSKEDSDAKRLLNLYNEIIDLIKKFKPEGIAVEEIFFNNNAKTVIIVGEARGVIMLAAEINKIPVFSYSPLKIKMAITGYGRADKEQVQYMVKNVLHLKSVPKPDDTADALAVALTHCFTYKLNKLISRSKK